MLPNESSKSSARPNEKPLCACGLGHQSQHRPVCWDCFVASPRHLRSTFQHSPNRIARVDAANLLVQQARERGQRRIAGYSAARQSGSTGRAALHFSGGRS